jgi:transmembrane sensor
MNARPSPSASAIADQAAAWIGRRDAGLTSAGADDFAAWCAADPAHAAAVAKFERIWRATDRAAEPGLAAALRARLGERRRVRHRRRLVAGTVAIGCLLLAVSLGLRPSAPQEPAARTVLHAPGRSVLPDGSVAEHPAGAPFTVDFSTDLRRVVMADGEAHFQVVPDAARPFVVVAGGVAVRAVGTAFAVRVTDRGADVAVTEGKVSIGTAAAAPAASAPATPLAFLVAGQAVEVQPAAAGRDAVVIALPAGESAARLAWRQRRAEFASVPLADVIAHVNRHNRVQFALAEPALAAVRLSGVFRLDDPAEFSEVLAQGFDLVSERESDARIVLRRRR